MSFGKAPQLFSHAVEQFAVSQDGRITRSVTRRDGSSAESALPVVGTHLGANGAELFDACWLRSRSAPGTPPKSPVIRSVDLFAGCGGLSVGVGEACRALGYELWPVLANDIDPSILGIYSRNMPETETVCAPVESLLDGELGREPTDTERALAARLGQIDLLVGGPPCQGHSDFNNHTRNDDPKNELYLRMARFCEVVRPTHVIIENVPGVERDKRQSAQRTWARLVELGYQLDSGVIDMSRIGVAQKRKRNITIASLVIRPSVESAIEAVSVAPRPLQWAIGDLQGGHGSRLIDQAPSPNATSRQRIDYLFDNNLHELPDSERPDCHRLKQHSYTSVYGRLYWDRPSPTITTGFGVMGRGRFVHPAERRTITPHEAARIQFFPDFFDFGPGPRTLIHKVIGNAVPPKAGYALALHLLR